jgi:hypothetical protein
MALRRKMRRLASRCRSCEVVPTRWTVCGLDKLGFLVVVRPPISPSRLPGMPRPERSRQRRRVDTPDRREGGTPIQGRVWPRLLSEGHRPSRRRCALRSDSALTLPAFADARNPLSDETADQTPLPMRAARSLTTDALLVADHDPAPSRQPWPGGGQASKQARSK